VTTHALKRSLRVVDVTAIGLNGVIGSGIFLLPGLVADKMGPAALLATVFAGFLCFLIALCFAEVGSRFDGTGGAYLYARAAFGGFIGFQVGWTTWWVRLISWAALANGFALALVELLPEGAADYQLAIAFAVVLALGGVNLRGARLGATVIDVFTVAKLLPLSLFVVVGLANLNGSLFTPFAPEGYAPFGETVLIILWAFVGFEMLAIPGGEMKNPQRDVPRALLLTLALVTVLYICVQIVAIGTLPGLAGSESPVAQAAHRFMGALGGGLIAVGVALSIFGSNAGTALVTPRAVYGLAEQGQMPAFFGAVHPVRHVPTAAIIASTLLTLALAASGSFEELAVIGVVARFLQYLPTCIAVLVFRHKDRETGDAPGFRIPFGPAVPILATILCALLLTQASAEKLLWGAAFVVGGIPFYLAFGRRARVTGGRGNGA